jgi:hypothetical protein
VPLLRRTYAPVAFCALIPFPGDFALLTLARLKVDAGFLVAVDAEIVFAHASVARVSCPTSLTFYAFTGIRVDFPSVYTVLDFYPRAVVA